MMDLQNLTSIFKERLLRIPDYQRGYAWTENQLKDFWEDLLQLQSDRVHYTGVITLESVPEKIWSKWEDDQWIIEDLGYKPFYVVDGQQRLTTSMILIQAIIESLEEGQIIASQSAQKIKEKFIVLQAEQSIAKSFIFGYEKDNPSNEFLKTQIFNESSSKYESKETLYTRNLIAAKEFFAERLQETDIDQIAVIYKKLTQKFKFNLYEISDEIDVFVTFETMNNRGKRLSHLELLKNRLIYLSTLFQDNHGKETLRTDINNAWKTIYEYLGKSLNNTLDDDAFLRNHWIMYFKFSKKKGDDYIKYLLEDKFTAKSVLHAENVNEALKIQEISDYVASLQKSIKYWFYMHNPYFKEMNVLTERQKLSLVRLNRLSFRRFKPLILAAYVAGKDSEQIALMLERIEKFNFTIFNISQRRPSTRETEFFNLSRKLLFGEIEISEAIDKINQSFNDYFDAKRFITAIEDKYKLGSREGFYDWDGLRYFQYEYEQHLKRNAKQSTDKLSWHEWNDSHHKDFVTIEHVFPQTPTDPYWISHFGMLNKEQQHLLTHSLGNLVPLSRAKNSKLLNHAFDLKVNDGNGCGYFNGSYSEIEISQPPVVWDPDQIKQRGLNLLNFLEKRWNIQLGDDSIKLKLLHVDFLTFNELEESA